MVARVVGIFACLVAVVAQDACKNGYTDYTSCPDYMSPDSAKYFQEELKSIGCPIPKGVASAIYRCPMARQMLFSYDYYKRVGGMHDLKQSTVGLYAQRRKRQAAGEENADGENPEGGDKGGMEKGGKGKMKMKMMLTKDGLNDVIGEVKDLFDAVLSKAVDIMEENGEDIMTEEQLDIVKETLQGGFEEIKQKTGCNPKDLMKCDCENKGGKEKGKGEKGEKSKGKKMKGSKPKMGMKMKGGKEIVLEDDEVYYEFEWGNEVMLDDVPEMLPTCGKCMRKARCCKGFDGSLAFRQFESEVCEGQDRPCELVPNKDGSCNFGTVNLFPGANRVADRFKVTFEKIKDQVTAIVGSDAPKYDCTKIGNSCMCCCGENQVTVDENGSLICSEFEDYYFYEEEDGSGEGSGEGGGMGEAGGVFGGDGSFGGLGDGLSFGGLFG